MSIHLMFLAKGHVSFRQPELAAKTWFILAEGTCRAGSAGELPGTHPSWHPALGMV